MAGAPLPSDRADLLLARLNGRTCRPDHESRDDGRRLAVQPPAPKGLERQVKSCEAVLLARSRERQQGTVGRPAAVSAGRPPEPGRRVTAGRAGPLHLADRDVGAAALLHDIGKLDVSRDVLYKAARLTEEEMTEIRQHVDRGVALLEPIGGSLRRVIPIILAHHDKFDGSGYHPTSGENIPIEARIISVADVYDSLTSDRPYRKAMMPLDVREMIARGAGTEFDPAVVEAFQ